MRVFYCSDCKLKFSTQGKLKEWEDKIYGKCRAWKAVCPRCKKEVGEAKTKFSKSEGCLSCSSGACSACSCQR